MSNISISSVFIISANKQHINSRWLPWRHISSELPSLGTRWHQHTRLPPHTHTLTWGLGGRAMTSPLLAVMRTNVSDPESLQHEDYSNNKTLSLICCKEKKNETLTFRQNQKVSEDEAEERPAGGTSRFPVRMLKIRNILTSQNRATIYSFRVETFS